MSRWRVSLLFASMALAAISRGQTPAPGAPPKDQDPATVEEGQLPPDEDKAKVTKEYNFNPLQSKKEVTVGEFYFKKGDFKAAAGRFGEATKWNDGNAEAWLRLGDAYERMKDSKAARDAWGKYLQLAPDAKNAGDVRKKLSGK